MYKRQIQDYEKRQATLALINELAKGKQSGEEKGWLSLDKVRSYFEAAPNEE